MVVREVVEILNSSLEKIAEIKNLYPLNDRGMVLRYSKELSDYGECVFRVKTNDPVFTQFGDILVPHRYHVRIKDGNTVVWQGAIVDNSHRTHNYQEILAHEYLYYLDKILIRRTDELSSGQGTFYRIFDSGTMATNVTTLLSEAATDFGSSHILTSITAGTITNPDFPPGLVNSSGTALTGTWTFSDDVKLQFDFHTPLFVIKQFALYGSCDFRINNDLSLDFKPFVGNKNPGLTFIYDTQGNIVDYDIPRYGKRMLNELIGVAADDLGEVLTTSKRDTVSMAAYGLLQGAMAFGDVKDNNNLSIRINEELLFIKDPESMPVNIVLNEKGYPLGVYDIGDIVSVKIKDGVIDYFAPRRVVRIVVNTHNTGRKLTTVTTNRPREKDLGSA